MAERATEERAPDCCMRGRRQAFGFLAMAMLAVTLAGCARGTAERWERPDWFRSKRGTTGNGGQR
jgi:hypothetical protein